MSKSILRIAVTGGAGQIANHFIFRLGYGELFGHDQPLALHILELPEMLPILEGVKMELQDCAFPLLHTIEVTSDPYQAFKDVDYAILIGAKPRTLGMERGDLLQENAKIFVQQGKALNEVAHEHTKVFVIGNPCNTNCLITLHQAPRLSVKNFYAMTRLDQNRGAFLLSHQAQVPVSAVSHLAIWGNHSATQVPDFIHARIHGQPVEHVIKDQHWLKNDFFDMIQKRGAVIIKAKGKSSAASAAQAILDMIKETLAPTKSENWFSAAVYSNSNPYGIENDLIFSFPCHTLKTKEIAIFPHLDMHEFLDTKIKISQSELIEERDVVRALLKSSTVD